MKQLERVYLLNVLLYIPTLETIKKFIQINKKCHEVSTMVRMYTKRRVRDSDFKEEATIPENLFTIFPMIQTVRCDERDLIEHQEILEEIKKLLGKTPVLGLGLGHLLVALALGAEVKKQKYGHRGSNQPVKCVKCGKVAISTQNHGYEVVSNSIKEGIISYVNVNDNSCEGIDYENLKAFTVQFTPEAYSIGNPINPLYAKFFTLMEKENENA